MYPLSRTCNLLTAAKTMGMMFFLLLSCQVVQATVTCTVPEAGQTMPAWFSGTNCSAGWGVSTSPRTSYLTRVKVGAHPLIL